MQLFFRIAFFILPVVGLLSLVGLYLSPQDELRPADAIVAVSGDEGQRLKTAVALKQDDWAPLLIFSGAARDPQSPSNAAIMRRAAIGVGVAPEDILVEESSLNTKQNAENTSEIIRARGMKRIILVTSPYHQRRTSLEFRQALGTSVEIINYSARDTSWAWSRWWLTPRGWYLTLTETPKLIYSWLN